MEYMDDDDHRKAVSKNRKPRNVNLDFLHNDKISQFERDRNEIPVKRKKLEALSVKVKKLEKISISDMGEEDIKELHFLKEGIKKIEAEIRNEEGNKNLYDYFVESGDILYQYYDAVDKTANQNKKRSLLEIFGPPPPPPPLTTPLAHGPSKQALLNKYLSIHHKDLVTEVPEQQQADDEMCCFCNTERLFFHQEALLICPTCGETELILLDSNRPSYKEPPREINFYSYKRINHFNEWLAQFQAKESTDIPEEVYNKIFLELKKERISNMVLINPVKMKEILKKLKYNKYYEHIPHIINHLNSIPAPIMSRETEEKLRSMFKQIQAPFMKYCPDDRNNFLSYSYVLHKFCQLLNLDEFLVCFPLLKSREKLHKHDQIWEKICEDLQWEFIKSI